MVLIGYLLIYAGSTFGNNCSPSNFEVIAKVRKILMKKLQIHHPDPTEFIKKHHNMYLRTIRYSEVPSVEVKFSRAIQDSFNQGVLDSDGSRKPMPCNMYVDDGLYADIRKRILGVQAYTLESCFKAMGFPEPEFRRLCIDIEKNFMSICSYTRPQLGYQVNTRKITVSLVMKKESTF